MRYNELVGMDIKDAKKILKKNNIKFKIKYKYSMTESKDTVIDIYKEDEYIVLVVSKLKIIFIILFIIIVLILLYAGLKVIIKVKDVTNNNSSVSNTSEAVITEESTSESTSTKKVSPKIDEETTTVQTTKSVTKNVTTSKTKKTTAAITTTVKINYYTVSYYVDNDKVESNKVEENTTVSEISSPTKEGYTFLGWYDGNTKYNFNSKVTSDLTLKAKFEINTYTITYMNDNSLYGKEVVNYKEKAKGINHLVKEGYTFNGWYLNDNKYDFNTEITSDITLTSSYIRQNNPTINLNLNDSYYIYSDINLSEHMSTDAETANINYYYIDVNDDSENYHEINNIKDITEAGTYNIYAKLTNSLGDAAVDVVTVTITSPKFDIKYSDNKDETHYYNFNVTLSAEVEDNEYAINDYKFYITEGSYSYTYDTSGTVTSTTIAYDENNYKEVNNLKGYEEGLYQIKMIAKDSRGYTFAYTEPTKIVYSSFDFSKGFTNSTITKTNINSINFVDGVSIDLDKSTNWKDISVLEDGGVIEWWVKNSNGNYDIYIGGQYSHYVESSSSDLSGLFKGFTNLKTIDMTYLSTKNATSIGELFSQDTNLSKIVYGDKWDTSSVNNFRLVFYLCNSLTSFDGKDFDISSAHNLYAFFAYARNIQTLDLSSWDTSSVVNMNSLFMHLENVKSLNTSGWDTSNVTDMAYMFYKAYGSSIYTVDMSSWKFISGVNISHMFEEAYRIKTTMNITNLVKNDFSNTFYYAANQTGSSITINYTKDTSTQVSNMISSKYNSNVLKGSLID